MKMNSSVQEENMDAPIPDDQNQTEHFNQVTLKEINDAEAVILVPVAVFYVIVMVLGLVGNTLVTIVHKLRPTRIFIVCLAVLDITACIVGIPYHVLDLMNPYTYFYPIICKILTFLITLPTIASMFILVIVAVDRYLRLCRPLGNELTNLESIRTCVIAVLCSLVVTWPYILMYGQSRISTGVGNITGSQCFFDESYADTLFPIVYTGFTLLIFLSVTLILIVLYIIIWRAVIKQEKYYNKLIKSSGANDKRFDTKSIFVTLSSCMRLPVKHHAAVESDDGKVCATLQNIELGVIGDEISHSCQMVNENPLERVPRADVIDSEECNSFKENESMSKANIHCSGAKEVNGYSKKASIIRLQSGTTIRSRSKSSDSNYNSVTHQKHQHRTKLTKIMFTITFVFIIAYLPMFCVSILDAIDETFWEDRSNWEIILYDTLLRFYLINNMAKPFIYVVWDRRFRTKCIRLFKRLVCLSASSSNEDML